MEKLSGPAQWLLGTWRSDKASTVAKWGKHPPGSPEFQAILLRDLGTLELQYTPKRLTNAFGESRTRTPYRLVWATATEAFVLHGRSAEERGEHLHFMSPNQYWVHAGTFIEFFTKVK